MNMKLTALLMKPFLIRILLMLAPLLLGHQISGVEFAITFKGGSAGRLGDEILMYSTAKWLSYKYNISFYATPFKNSKAFSIHNIDKLVDSIPQTLFPHKIEIKSEDELIQHIKTRQENTLFIVIYQTAIHFSSNLVLNGRWPDKYMNIYAQSREHPAFCDCLQKILTPTIQINKISLPKDRVNVAVHIRKGSGDDAGVSSIQYADEWEFVNTNLVKKEKLFWGIDRGNPFRFPPEQFYVDQIINISNLLNHQPMFVYIFTDDKNPTQLVKRLKMRMPLPNISFDYAKNNTGTNRADNDISIIEDLYNMAQFDCLIKPESGFSAAAQLIGNHKILIYPQIISWNTNTSLNQAMLQIIGSGIVFHNYKTLNTSYFNFDEITTQHRQFTKELF